VTTIPAPEEGFDRPDDVSMPGGRSRHQKTLRVGSKGRTNITFTCGATTLEPPQPPESAGAAGIDLSVEVTTAARLELRQKGQAISTKIQPRSTAKGRSAGVFATRSRRARIAVRCYVC